MKDGLTSVDVAGVDGVVDDAVLVELVVQDLHLDLEELVLPAYMCSSEIMRIIQLQLAGEHGGGLLESGNQARNREANLMVLMTWFDVVLPGRTCCCSTSWLLVSGTAMEEAATRSWQYLGPAATCAAATALPGRARPARTTTRFWPLAPELPWAARGRGERPVT